MIVISRGDMADGVAYSRVSEGLAMVFWSFLVSKPGKGISGNFATVI